ncbi:MAG: DUF5074 domain-containing protein [Candidatus Limimorpha sp.]
MMKKINLIILPLLVFSMISCNKGKGNDIVDDNAGFNIGRGVFVLNEGTFTYANSSLSFYDNEADTVCNNLFFRVNNAPIGDVGQSLHIYGDDIFIVVNNSKYIYKADLKTMIYKGKIADLTSPRYICPFEKGKAYVTDLASPGLWVVDLNTMENKGFIETGKSTEAIVRVGDELFVSNWSNYYVTSVPNNTVQIIDTGSDSLVGEIEVATEPNSMAVDRDNNVWVLCGGGYSGSDKDPALLCIESSSRKVVKRFDFNQGGDYPCGLVIDGDGETLFFLNGAFGSLDLYKMSVGAQTLPEEPFISGAGKVYYNINVDHQNGDIYITDAKNYVQNGEVERYSSKGELISCFTVGLIPNNIVFNY